MEAVKPLDHERPLSCEFPYLGSRGRQPESGGQPHAQMFVLDALREVDPVRQLADFRLKDMRGRRAAMRHLPPILPVQQRRFLLRAREGDAKLLALVDAKRRALEIAQDIGDFRIFERSPLYAAGRSGIRPVGEELQGADAIAADSGKEAIGVIPPCPHPLGQAPADLVVIGKQVIEHGNHGIAEKTILAQRQRQRHRKGLFPGKPVLIVLKINGAARLPS